MVYIISKKFKTYLCLHFREFYGTESPYADLLDYLENPLPIFSTTRGKGYKSKDAPIIRPLHLTLEEVSYKIILNFITKMRMQNEDKSFF